MLIADGVYNSSETTTLSGKIPEIIQSEFILNER
jgi:hypothetical protein